MNRIAAVVAGLSLAFVGTSTTIAATINVPADQPTIAAAISASVNGDVISIAAGTYNEHSLNPNGKAITIGSASGNLDVTIDAQQGGTVFVIGSGEVAETALDAFHSRGSRAITVTGRTFKKARGLAENVGGSTLSFNAFRDSLHLFDVVICSTAGEDAILSRDAVRTSIAKRPARPLFLIDVAMPRDVEESAGDLENVYLYNLDDVSSSANENLKNRQSEVARCREALAKRAAGIWNQLVTSPRPPS